MNSVLIHIPKTAGSYCMRRLGILNLSQPETTRDSFKNSGHVSFGHQDYLALVSNGIVSRAFYLSAFVYCFCRNPYDRAVSHFFYTRERHPEILPRSVSFLDYTRNLSKFRTPSYFRDKLGTDEWFRPQWKGLHGVVPDFIGRYERLEMDIKRIASILGVKLRRSRKIRVSRHGPYWEYYCKESMKNIREYYIRDFELFRYDDSVLH